MSDVSQASPEPETQGERVRTRAPAPYTYVCEIARGGIGRVDLVLRSEGAFSRLYAIKRLLPIFEDDPTVREMFLDEARVAGMLRHPNAVSVLDVGEDDDGFYLVMDYVEGFALASLIRQSSGAERQLPLQICLKIMAQVARGLHAAHELRDADGTPLNLVHRDVSPQNILVEPNGNVRVTDFGIAKAIGQRNKTSTGMLKGKIAYTAPEVLRFEEADRRSDLFSFGVVLYEIVSGTRLYPGKDLNAAARLILSGPTPDMGAYRIELPPSLVELGFQLLAKDPAHRPATAKEVAERLEAVLDELEVEEGKVDLEAYLRQTFDYSDVEQRRTLAHRARDLTIPVHTPPADEPRTVTKWMGTRRWFVVPIALGMLVLGTSIGLAVGVLGSSSSEAPSNAAIEPTAPARAEPSAARAEPVIEEPPPVEPAMIDTPVLEIAAPVERVEPVREERDVATRRVSKTRMRRTEAVMRELNPWSFDRPGGG